MCGSGHWGLMEYPSHVWQWALGPHGVPITCVAVGPHGVPITCVAVGTGASWGDHLFTKRHSMIICYHPRYECCYQAFESQEILCNINLTTS